MKDEKLNKHIIDLLDDLLKRARKAGLAQQDLAHRANISPVGLSQAKRRGDLRVSTLEALANALDLTLSIEPRHTRERAAAAIRQGRFLQFDQTDPAAVKRRRGP